jgi:hypothetical protein
MQRSDILEHFGADYPGKHNIHVIIPHLMRNPDFLSSGFPPEFTLVKTWAGMTIFYTPMQSIEEFFD